jgi:hypothetical protein
MSNYLYLYIGTYYLCTIGGGDFNGRKGKNIFFFFSLFLVITPLWESTTLCAIKLETSKY